MIDIGLNIGSNKFNKDLELVLQRGLDHGLYGYIFTGTSLETIEKSESVAEKFPNISRFTSGIHPHRASSWTGVKHKVAKHAEHPLCVAIGECGLDYDRMFSCEIDQKYALEEQMELALKLDKPLFLHIRGIDNNPNSEKKILGDFKEIYTPYREKGVRGVVHCFTMGSRSLETLKAMELYFGVTGWICDEKRGANLRSILKYIPNERIMIETDAPYLTPPQAKQMLPDQNRNEPMTLPYVLEMVAKLKNKSPDEMKKIMRQNAERLFNVYFE